MAGVYLHIPFCKQACHYCDFHFSTSLRNRTDLLAAMEAEIALQTILPEGTVLETVYFGGGTPSLLSPAEIEALIQALQTRFTIAPDAEITLEANPDDLHPETLRAWNNTPINRLSIGIQSFNEELLRWMNRAHTAQEATRCLDHVQAAGFDNYTIDLIYGIPGLSMAQWQADVEKALMLNVPHLSAYALTMEPRTAFAHQVKKGTSAPPDENGAIEQFTWMVERMQQAGYRHYEISSFCRDDLFSRHNTSYWLGKPYLGLGPSAHSFDGTRRYWNVANNVRYIQSLTTKTIPATVEELSESDRFNETVMTQLRMDTGLDVAVIDQRYGPRMVQHIRQEIKPYLAYGQVILDGTVYRLSLEGKLMADRIAADLFYLDS